MSRLNVNVSLAPGELEALLSMARRDCRLPAQQLRHLLRTAAQQQGLLPTEPPAAPRATMENTTTGADNEHADE